MRVAEAKRTLESAAKRFGGWVEDDSYGQQVVLQVCAPDGKLWVESDGCHLVVATARGPQAWLDEAVTDALQRIAAGTYDEADL